MKKIFAISVLSVMAVVGTTNAWAEVDIPNYNLATVNYVEDIRDSLENNIYNNMVQKSYVAESGDTVSDTGKDTYIPTVARMDAAINSVYEEVQEKVNVEQGETNKNAIMITDSTGNVIPALVGDCANTTNKCALVTGVDANGNLALQWEVIARNVVQPTAEE